MDMLCCFLTFILKVSLMHDTCCNTYMDMMCGCIYMAMIYSVCLFRAEELTVSGEDVEKCDMRIVQAAAEEVSWE